MDLAVDRGRTAASEGQPRRQLGNLAARLAGIPVLGICRGMQLLNVAAGGAWCKTSVVHAKPMPFVQAPRAYPTHWVTVVQAARHPPRP